MDARLHFLCVTYTQITIYSGGRHDNQHNNIERNDTQHNELNFLKLSIPVLSADRPYAECRVFLLFCRVSFC
jgi:hypothetical protein